MEILTEFVRFVEISKKNIAVFFMFDDPLDDFRVSGQNVCLVNYSTEYGYAVLLWSSDHVRPLPHSTGSMLGAGFPA